MTEQETSFQGSSVASDSVTIVNIDAKTNTQKNPIVKFFKAGAYEVSVIGTSQGGRYDAWSLWDITFGCDEKGENCTTGWLNEYNIVSKEFNINIPTTDKYSTPEQALASAQTTSFTLISDGQVNFYINDELPLDNRGGMSLAVKKKRKATDDAPLAAGASFIIILIIVLFVVIVWGLAHLVNNYPAISK